MMFKKADDREDFKSIEKRPLNQSTERFSLKVSKHLSDGFEDNENHIRPHPKQRRANINDTRMGHLELTQKGTFTQKIQSPTWPRGQKKKTRTTTIASLWARRQYLGDSQIKVESQDPLESFDDETEPDPRFHAKKRNRGALRLDIEEWNDDEEVDLLVFPPDDAEKSENEVIDKDDDEVKLLVEPDELGEEQLHVTSEDEEMDLLIIPKTDTPEPDGNVALTGRTGL